MHVQLQQIERLFPKRVQNYMIIIINFSQERIELLVQMNFVCNIFMEQSTKNYIDQLVQPLLNRIDDLQKINQQLKVHFKYLESILVNEKSYAKPTISAANHMRQSRISSKLETSPEKRPIWNSKTKINYVPVVNLQPPNNQISKAKPSFPKLIRSSSKPEHQRQIKNSSESKRGIDNAYQRDINQSVENVNNSNKVPVRISKSNREIIQNDEQQNFEQNIGQIKSRSPQIGILNYKFQQLIKYNTEILSSMKQNNQAARQSLKQLGIADNYVQKVGAPKSDFNQQSKKNSPIDLSFFSESQTEDKNRKSQLK